MKMANDRSKSHEAAALLRRAASILTQNFSENQGSSSQNVRNNNIGNIVQNTAHQIQQPAVSEQATCSTASTSSNALNQEEFRRLFAPYNRTNNSSLVHQRPAFAKRGRSNSWGQTRYFKPQDTWTHDFFCLANPEQQCVPGRTEKLMLQSAGLGRKRISLNKNDDALHFKIKIEEVYPKLASGEGFELLRSSTSPRDLDLIHPLKRGYSVPFLRDSSGLGQAIAYLRPIQQSLDTTPLELDDSQEKMSLEV